MSSRIGICQQCGQRFGDIPDTLTATQVKCPECGGVVDIPPAAEASTPPEPAKPASPPAGGGPVARPLGDSKKTERPSEARSVDRDVAAPAPKPPAAKPVVPPKPVAKKPVVPPKPVAKKPVVPPKPVAKKPVVPPKPVAKKPVVPPKPVAKKPAAPAPKPAAAAPAAHKPSAADILAKAKAKRAAQSGAASSERKPTAAEILAKAKAKRAAESAGKATAAPKRGPSGQAPVRRMPSGPPAAGGGRRQPPAAGAARGAGSRARRREREEEMEYEETGPNGVQIASGIVLVLALAGGAWWMLRPTDETAPVNTAVVAPVPAPSDTGTTGPGIDPNAGDSSAGGATESSSGAGTSGAGADAGSGDGDSGGGGETSNPAEASAETAPKPTPSSGAPSVWSTPEDPMTSIEWRNFEDPAAMLLREVPPLPRHPSTSDEVWAEVQEDLALFVADSGVMSTRAGDRLLAEHGRDAFPAIINSAMAVDWDGDGGSRAAGMLVNLMDRKWVKSGSRFGWTEPALYEKGSDDWKEAMVTAKSVVLRWRNYWVQTLGVTDTGWENFSGEKVSAGSGGDGGGVVAPPDPFD